MVIFFLWLAFFAIELFVLKSNYDTANEADGVNLGVGYSMIAFQNGIMGNIENPTVENWLKDGAAVSNSGQIIITMVYLLWFANQFVMGIVLLNFVIA